MRCLPIALLFTWLTVGASWAAEPRENCTEWNNWPQEAKVYFLYGYMIGVELAQVVAQDDVMTYTWPKGHRVASVLLEVDLLCREMSYAPFVTLKRILYTIALKQNQPENVPPRPHLR